MKRIKNFVRKIKVRMDAGHALDIIEQVCEEHIPGKYVLKKTKTEIVASSKISQTVYAWEYEIMNEALIHCLAHSFCAEVIMDELELELD